MAQVPVKDAGRLELAQLAEAHSQWARREPHRGCVSHQLTQVRALEADGESSTQLRQIVVLAESRRDGRQASEAALAGFALEL